MSTITAAQVKELRDQTGLGMMECKKALVDSGGDQEAAIKALRERGEKIAEKKGGRDANEGMVAAEVFNGGKSGVMIEVNCETDFVARNETFQAWVADLLERSKEIEGSLAEAIGDELTGKIQEIGENLIIGRNERFDVQGNGQIASYIHLGSKIGVLVEIGCEKDGTPGEESFREMAKDITQHITACVPQYLSRDEVPEDAVNAEKDIFAKQAEGKPAEIVDKIVNGKIEKYYAQICLVEQGFVKDPDKSVAQLLEEQGKALDDTLSIRRFTRFQIGG